MQLSRPSRRVEDAPIPQLHSGRSRHEDSRNSPSRSGFACARRVCRVSARRSSPSRSIGSPAAIMRRISTRRRWAGTKRPASTSISRPDAARPPRRRRSAPARRSLACPTWPACCCSAARALDLVGLMNVYANSPQGLYWLKSSGINSRQGSRRQEDRQSGGRRRPHHVAGAGQERSASTRTRSPGSTSTPTPSSARSRRKTIDATTSFFNLHHVFARELGSRHGLPRVEGRRRESLRQLDHRQRRVAQGQPATRPTSSSRSRRRHLPSAPRRRSRASRRWSRPTARCSTRTS